MLQPTVQSMGEHVSILICDLAWFTLRSLAFIQDASVFYYPLFGKDIYIYNSISMAAREKNLLS